MIDKVKNMAISQGMKMMSDPRVMKMMSDPRLMTLMMKAFEMQSKVTSAASDTTKALAEHLSLASRDDVEELREEVLSLRERVELLEQEKGSSND